ncbi:MAG: hypothetical protein J6T82_07985 [Bacteroidaceae bacterium]|nr:hypothetical protein [Bacteroidaceae bacterium]
MGFWKSLFTGKDETPEESIQKEEEKNFDIFKFDGVRAQRMGRLDYALRCFDEALNIKEDFETLSYKSTTLIAMNRLEEARDVLIRMAELQPQRTETHITLAHILFMTDEYEAMKANALKAVECNAENPMAYYLLGKAEEALQHPVAAIEALTRSIEKQPDFIEALNSRASLFVQTSESEKAMADIKEVLTLHEEDETALALRAFIYNKVENDSEKAKADYRHIIELNPFNKEAYAALIDILQAEGNAEEVKKLEDEANALNLNNEDLPNYTIGGMEKRDVLGL